MKGLGVRDILRADLPKISLAIRTDSDHANPILRVMSTLERWKKRPNSYVMKLPVSPPLPILWNRRTKSALSPAQVVHQTYYREAWRERTGWSRAKMLGAFLLIWPFKSVVLMVWSTSLNGRAVKRRVGKGIARQLVEQLKILFLFHLQAPSYYSFDLYDDHHRRHAAEYLQRFETKGGVYRLFKRYLHTKGKSSLADKVRFDECCRQHGLRAIPVLAISEGGAIRFSAGSELPRVDLFLKPTKGRGGAGADWWRRDGAGSYQSSAGMVLTQAELTDHLAKLSLAEPYLVSPRLENHPDLSDLANGALSTIRIVTIRNETGGFEATDAVFRMAVGSNTVVDNFHAGGLAADVDMTNGELGSATDLGLRPDHGWCERHPSGATILGRKLPYWSEAIDLAQRAHAAFADRVLIGWDVAILADGPCLVEGNGSPDVDIHQRCKQIPMGCTRLGELLAFNTRRALAARDASIAVSI